MYKPLLLLALIYLSSCSHQYPNKDVQSFMHSWNDQNETKDKQYSLLYERYLNSVAKIFHQYNRDTKFRSYLDSLNSNYIVLSQQQEALPDIYTQKTGRTIASDKSAYELFKTYEMTALHDKLFEARELKLKDEVGDELYLSLKSNYKSFVDKERAQEFGFPL